VQILLAPLGHPGVILDSVEEQNFRRLATLNFSFRHNKTAHSVHNDRAASWYQLDWKISTDNTDSSWRITSDGDVGYARQIRLNSEDGKAKYWSLGDIVADLLLLLAVARSWWRNAGFFGEAQLVVAIIAHNLALDPGLATELSPNSPEKWAQMLNFDSALANAIVSSVSKLSQTGNATGIFNAGIPYDRVTELAADILNQLLRSMGHAANLNALRSAVEIFVRAYGE
jgi:hypothetical protein